MISMCRSDSRRRYGLAMALTGLFLLAAPVLRAQEAPESAVPRNPDPDPEPDPIPVMFPHPEWDRLWISGQANFISQWHPAFHSPYQGRNSLSPEAQDASSRVLTLYTGLRLNNSAELLCDVQETGGHGIGEALGLAGFTKLDVVRNPSSPDVASSYFPKSRRCAFSPHAAFPFQPFATAPPRNPFRQNGFGRFF